MSHNLELDVMHVRNSSAFARNVNARVVKGSTLLIDYVFFLHPVSYLFNQHKLPDFMIQPSRAAARTVALSGSPCSRLTTNGPNLSIMPRNLHFQDEGCSQEEQINVQLHAVAHGAPEGNLHAREGS